MDPVGKPQHTRFWPISLSRWWPMWSVWSWRTQEDMSLDSRPEPHRALRGHSDMTRSQPVWLGQDSGMFLVTASQRVETRPVEEAGGLWPLVLGVHVAVRPHVVLCRCSGQRTPARASPPRGSEQALPLRWIPYALEA